MGVPLPKPGLARRASQFFSVVAVAALILVFLGPAIDHHFAERQHDHSHLYLSSAAANHGHPGLHPFEQLHSHGAVVTNDAEQDGVIYQTSDDRTGDSGSASGAVVINNGLSLLIDGRDLLSLAVAPGEGLYLEAFVPPPKKPPRA